MKYKKEDLEQLVLILRFGSARPKSTTHKWQSYRAIASMVNQSASHVRRICVDFLK